MKQKDIFKEIFSLAIRLLGLYFLFVGLKDLDVQTLMDVATLKGDSLEDIISAILPVVFNLAIAWWLLGRTWLIRRAYPEAPKNSDLQAERDRAMPAPKLAPLPGLIDAETTEKKLAALVGKPNDDHGF
jgi:hypothetical protein